MVAFLQLRAGNFISYEQSICCGEAGAKRRGFQVV